MGFVIRAVGTRYRIWERVLGGHNLMRFGRSTLQLPYPSPARQMAQAGVHLAESFTDPPNYSFPHHRLSRTLRDPSKTPIVLVACGSFSPVTYLHLRMFEMAKDYVRQNTDFEIVGAYLSPVSDQYKKPGLLSARHRYVTQQFLSYFPTRCIFALSVTYEGTLLAALPTPVTR